MNEFVYTVSLVGDNVQCKHSTQCVIKQMSDLDKARDIIEKIHGIEFERLSSRFFNGY